MKKISIVFALLMVMGFTGVSSAATLTWGLTPTTNTAIGQSVTETLDNNATISADYGFGLFTGGFSHLYNFTADTATPVIANLIELFNENIIISGITLDNVAMTFDSLTQRWTGLGTSGVSHVISLSGTVLAVGQQYLVSVSSVPVPAAIWLFGSAIGGLVSISRRKIALKALNA